MISDNEALFVWELEKKNEIKTEVITTANKKEEKCQSKFKEI